MVTFTREELKQMDYQAMIDTSYDDGIADGMLKGKTEGKSERNIEIARAMNLKGFSHEDIREITGLSIDELKGL